MIVRPLYTAEEPLLSVEVPRLTWAGACASSVPFQDQEKVTLRLLTPMRLEQKKRLIDRASRFTFPAFMSSLLTRISRISRYYCGQTERRDFSEMEALMDLVSPAARGLHWEDWNRYSRQQDREMNWGGLQGWITFTGPVGPFAPYLLLGKYVHVGKNTAFGLGQYDLSWGQRPQLPPEPEP
jgi:hypothetical protein